MPNLEEIIIDEADLRLLDLLQTDASQSNQSLAEQAHPPGMPDLRISFSAGVPALWQSIAHAGADRAPSPARHSSRAARFVKPMVLLPGAWPLVQRLTTSLSSMTMR